MKIVIDNPRAIVPTRKHKFDAGIDLYGVQEIEIPARGQIVVDTGLSIAELPDMDYPTALFIWPRSGLDARLAVTTGAGVIDYLYRGSILILLKNESDNRVIIPYGTPCAQGVIQPVWVGDVTVVDKKDETDRGASGGITNEVRTR